MSPAIRTNGIPMRPLVVAGGVAVLAVWLALWVAGLSPWLGIQLVPNSLEQGDGVRIDAVMADGPAAGQLHAGDRIVAVAGATGPWVRLKRIHVIQEPDKLAGFAGFNLFLDHQGRLARILSSSKVRVRLASGDVVRVQPGAHRPWTSLSAGYWLLITFGVLSLLITAGVWSSARETTMRVPVRVLCLSGLGFSLTAISSAVYIERELALDPALFRTLELINQAELLLFAFTGAAILWCYPRRLTRFPLQWLLVAIAALVWLNMLFQWRNLPIHNIYMPLLAVYVLAVIMSLVQWWKTRGDPLARVALKWFMLAIFITTGVALGLYFVPIIIGADSLVSAAATAGIGLLMFVGLAAGVVRYRLFDIERWWLNIWLWFGAAVAVVCMDGLFVFVMGVVPLRAFGLAIIIVGWFYIPARTRVWKLVRSNSAQWWERYLPDALEAVFSAPNRAVFIQRWTQFLQKTFRPLDIHPINSDEQCVKLTDNGIGLLVPPLGGGAAQKLMYKQRGSKLFTKDDVRLAESSVAIADRSLHAFEARQRGIVAERERIMRDLHDDVGASLLSLSRRCQEPRDANLAHAALETLRDVVHSLSMDATSTLPEAVADWRGEAVERCEEANIAFHWQVNEPLPEIPLTGLVYVNLRRCLQEAVSNLIKHAKATRADFVIDFNNGWFTLNIQNDGVFGNTKVPGRGLHNITTRTEELGGKATHNSNGQWFTLYIQVPMAEEADTDDARAAS